ISSRLGVISADSVITVGASIDVCVAIGPERDRRLTLVKGETAEEGAGYSVESVYCVRLVIFLDHVQVSVRPELHVIRTDQAGRSSESTQECSGQPVIF